MNEKHRLDAVISFADTNPAFQRKIIPVITHGYWAKLQPEIKAQILLNIWMSVEWPELLYFHVENEGNKSPMMAWVTKYNGLRSGIPDMMIFKNSIGDGRLYAGYAVELKIHPNKASENQLNALKMLDAAGWKCDIVTGMDVADLFTEARMKIDRYIRMGHIANDTVESYRGKPFDPNMIFAVVCDYFGVNMTLVSGNRRFGHIIICRQFAQYFMYYLGRISFEKVGIATSSDPLKPFDHATVRSNCNVIRNYYHTDKQKRLDYENIYKLILSRNAL